jgi:hypothetical protein
MRHECASVQERRVITAELGQLCQISIRSQNPVWRRPEGAE